MGRYTYRNIGIVYGNNKIRWNCYFLYLCMLSVDRFFCSEIVKFWWNFKWNCTVPIHEQSARNFTITRSLLGKYECVKLAKRVEHCRTSGDDGSSKRNYSTHCDGTLSKLNTSVKDYRETITCFIKFPLGPCRP